MRLASQGGNVGSADADSICHHSSTITLLSLQKSGGGQLIPSCNMPSTGYRRHCAENGMPRGVHGAGREVQERKVGVNRVPRQQTCKIWQGSAMGSGTHKKGGGHPWPIKFGQGFALQRERAEHKQTENDHPGQKIWPGLRPPENGHTRPNGHPGQKIWPGLRPPRPNPQKREPQDRTDTQARKFGQGSAHLVQIHKEGSLPCREESAKAERGVASHKPPHTATYQGMGAGEARAKSPIQGTRCRGQATRPDTTLSRQHNALNYTQVGET